jgi:hypothetical protein
MRLAFYLVALAAGSAAGWYLFRAASSQGDLWFGLLGGVSCLAVAGAFVAADLRRYRGHWPFALGTVIIALALSSFGSAMKATRWQAKAGTTEVMKCE